jgi:hypothetical protein
MMCAIISSRSSHLPLQGFSHRGAFSASVFKRDSAVSEAVRRV